MSSAWLPYTCGTNSSDEDCHCEDVIAASVRKLPKLENLAVETEVVPTHFDELPHLKSLYVHCDGDFIEYVLMRKRLA